LPVPALPSPPPPAPGIDLTRSPRQPIVLNLDSTNRAEADRLRRAGDLDALRRLAIPSGDGYVRRRLALLLIDRGDYHGLRDFAVYSRKAARELVELLCEQGDVPELLKQVVCGNGFARRALNTGWSITNLSDEERSRIVDRGLRPDGTPA
jgi:hypothetical protein